MTRTQALRIARSHNEVTHACRRFIYRGLRAGLVVTSTIGGTHARGSWHYARWRGKGRAVDMASPKGNAEARRRDEHAFFVQEVKRELRFRGTAYLELFGPGHSYIKNGQRLRGQFPGHTDHVHGAPKGVL